MLTRGQGNQINIASLNNDRPLKGVMPYAVSKAGLGQMTRSLAMEWGPRGIRVNAIAPGFVLTDLTKKLWSQPKMQEWGMTNTPLRRLGQPDDMVGACDLPGLGGVGVDDRADAVRRWRLLGGPGLADRFREPVGQNSARVRFVG